MLGCSTSQHKHFPEKQVQTDDFPILHGEEVQIVRFYRELSMYMYTCSCTILVLSQIIMPSKFKKEANLRVLIKQL